MRVFYPDSDSLGILVCERPTDPPFAESSFVRRLIRTGTRLGLTVFAFAPWTWRESDDTVRAWTPADDGKGWASRRLPLPAALYDRFWPETPADRQRYQTALRTLDANRRVLRLNGKLPGKAQVHHVLSRCPEIGRLLPPTDVYRDTDLLHELLERHGGAVFLKPDCGSQGRRVAAFTRLRDGTFRIRGRRHDNLPFRTETGNWEDAAARISRWIGGRTYLVQPLLALDSPDGEPFDIRALVQKNGSGRWSVAGIAARCGRPGTVTANLHGGGRALPAEEKLAGLFGPFHAAELINEIKDGCRTIVRRIEQHFGRFAELGLDFGVDRSGRLWFLEANSKPGRACMTAIGAAAAEAASARPVAYARSILLRPPGRVIHEFDHL